MNKNTFEEYERLVKEYKRLHEKQQCLVSLCKHLQRIDVIAVSVHSVSYDYDITFARQTLLAACNAELFGLEMKKEDLGKEHNHKEEKNE